MSLSDARKRVPKNPKDVEWAMKMQRERLMREVAFSESKAGKKLFRDKLKKKQGIAKKMAKI